MHLVVGLLCLPVLSQLRRSGSFDTMNAMGMERSVVVEETTREEEAAASSSITTSTIITASASVSSNTVNQSNLSYL